MKALTEKIRSIGDKIVPVTVSVVVALVYGAGMLGGLLPFHGFISWEGHLFGAVRGAAYLLRKN